jgi:hypothetical protein
MKSRHIEKQAFFRDGPDLSLFERGYFFDELLYTTCPFIRFVVDLRKIFFPGAVSKKNKKFRSEM